MESVGILKILAELGGSVVIAVLALYWGNSREKRLYDIIAKQSETMATLTAKVEVQSALSPKN